MDPTLIAGGVLAVTAIAMLAVYVVTAYRPRVRAEALLREHLSQAELAVLDRHGFLEVPSRVEAGRVYRVPTEGSVTVVQNGVPVLRLCIQPATPLPGREAILAHKILIEAAEHEYVRQANLVWRNWDVVGDAASIVRWRNPQW